MHSTSIAPITMITSLWTHRHLIRRLVVREIVGRYRGSALGMLWSFFNPVFMLAVYTFVFSVVFKARWAVSDESKAQFALVLFAGLIFFNLFAECINRAPTLILTNVNYVKKVIFPLEILPWVVYFTALFHAFISFIVWLLFSLIIVGPPPATIYLLPLVLLPLTLIVMGLSWLLAALGVYLRDVTHVVGIIVTTLMFLTPIFYPVAAIPEHYRPVIYLNPLTYIVEQGRNVMIFGTDFSWLGMFLMIMISSLLAWLGFAWFQKTRKGFADVL